MDFVSKALGSLNMGLPFTLGDQVQDISGQPWKLYDAVLKKDGSNVSVFDYEERDQAAAENATAALRKMKLPGIVKHVDTVVSGKHTYVMTERVLPFHIKKLSIEAKKYILRSVLDTLNTLFTVAKCKHNSLCSSTVLQSCSTGLPLLVGFDLATIDNNAVPTFASLYNTLPYPPAEGWSSTTLDTYQFGTLVEDFLPEETRLISTLKSNRRPTITKLASSNSAEMVFRNPISPVVTNIGRVVLLSEHELEDLCEELNSISSKLYAGLTKGSLLPELLKTKNPKTLRTNLILISSLLTSNATTRELPLPLADEDVVSQYIVLEFQSMDRVVRLELLRFLPQYIKLLSDRLVQQKIMPKMVFGFGDNEVMMRKASVAAVEYLTEKLSLRQLNTDLLRLLAKTHNDVDPDVRALTTTILCRIAPKLESRSVISTALSRALKDPAPKCRNAALRGVLQIDVPSIEIAEKLLGPAAAGMLDKDPQVSAEAWRVTEKLLAKIHKDATSDGPASEPAVETIDPMSIPPSQASQQSRMQTPDAPSAVPTPLSTLRRATVQHHNNPREDGIQPVANTSWKWNAATPEAEEVNVTEEEAEDAWGWGDEDTENNANNSSSAISKKKDEADDVVADEAEAQAIEDAWGW